MGDGNNKQNITVGTRTKGLRLILRNFSKIVLIAFYNRVRIHLLFLITKMLDKTFLLIPYMVKFVAYYYVFVRIR